MNESINQSINQPIKRIEIYLDISKQHRPTQLPYSSSEIVAIVALINTNVLDDDEEKIKK